VLLLLLHGLFYNASQHSHCLSSDEEEEEEEKKNPLVGHHELKKKQNFFLFSPSLMIFP
jgi:hypothetical protein